MSFLLQSEFVHRTCCHENCGVSFALSKGFLEQRKKDHGTFYCPNGHSLHFPSESAEEKLRRENQRLVQNEAYLHDQIRKEKENKEASKRQARAFKGVITRTKNRVGAGVCPCCNRSFENLKRHMDDKHPKYRKEKVVA